MTSKRKRYSAEFKAKVALEALCGELTTAQLATKHGIHHVKWHPFAGQFGGFDKLGSGCCQAANLSISVAPYASSGVRPARVECGRRAL
jgi:transposase